MTSIAISKKLVFTVFTGHFVTFFTKKPIVINAKAALCLGAIVTLIYITTGLTILLEAI
jgi:hypothetical protein